MRSYEGERLVPHEEPRNHISYGQASFPSPLSAETGLHGSPPTIKEELWKSGLN